MSWDSIDKMIGKRISEGLAQAAQDAPYIVEVESPVLWGNLGGSNDGSGPNYRAEWQPSFSSTSDTLDVALNAPYAAYQNTKIPQNAGYADRIEERVVEAAKQSLKEQF